jgi:CheY-like chemotaxis protein
MITSDWPPHGIPNGVSVLPGIGLPGMDGYEMAARLRREEWCKGSVPIAVSGYGEEARDRSKEAGSQHQPIKPVDFDTILALIDGP